VHHFTTQQVGKRRNKFSFITQNPANLLAKCASVNNTARGKR